MSTEKLILGLDLGTNSVGWALTRESAVGELTAIVDLAISVSLAGKSLPLMVACGYFIAQCKAALSAPQALELPVWDYQQ